MAFPPFKFIQIFVWSILGTLKIFGYLFSHLNIFRNLFGQFLGIQIYSDICSNHVFDIRSPLVFFHWPVSLGMVDSNTLGPPPPTIGLFKGSSYANLLFLNSSTINTVTTTTIIPMKATTYTAITKKAITTLVACCPYWRRYLGF